MLGPVFGCHSSQDNVTHRQASQHLDFNEDVQPVLASHCFSCHGPDPEMRKAGLRLDLAEYAMKKRDGHPDAIVPYHPEKSEIIKRIESHDKHYLMPQNPQGQASPMKPEEIAILKEWIKEGAVYRPHWAFEKPVRPAVPQPADNTHWAKNPIDTFLLAKMQKEGLHPSPEADKETLIRRVTLDLTGLLPTPEEVKAFEADNSPDAYERVVDRLLASPAFGEQRARYWLDYARYSDTYGLHFDNSRHVWPWRDYVIRSFNSNKPFNQFAMEQLAGDMMKADSIDPLIGSGYVRMNLSSNEGGTIPQELKVNIARDRTEAFGAMFLGLTVGCAVCHDHKYDPTTQKDFYSLSAFFNNIDEVPYNKDRPVWTPVVRLPLPEHAAAFDQVIAKQTALNAQLEEMRNHGRELVEQWIASGQNKPQPVSSEKLALRLRLDEGGGDVLKNSAPHAQTASFPIGKIKPQWGETTWLWPDFRLETGTRIDLGQTGDYDWNQPFSFGSWMMVGIGPNYSLDNADGALVSKMDTTQHNRGWDLEIKKGILTVHIVNQSPKDFAGQNKDAKETLKRDAIPDAEAFRYPSPVDLTKKDLAPYKPPPDTKQDPKEAAKKKAEEAKKKADDAKKKAEDAKKYEEERKKEPPMVGIQVATVDPIPPDGDWRHITFTYDGSGKAAGVKVYLDGKSVATRVLSDTLNHATIRTRAPMQLGWRYPETGGVHDLRYQDLRLYGRVLSAEETARLPMEDIAAEIFSQPQRQWNRDQWHTISQYYLNRVDPSYRAAQSEIAELNKQLVKLSAGGPLTQVAWEKPTVAYAHVLTRGVYSDRVERVEANTPHYLPSLPADERHDRLALAQWVVSPENPLTTRVTVNRMWYELFGTGIVETTEDFGIMGQRPTHPQLLDWLAVEFRDGGWNIKHMYKLMVMSAAYRQSAKSTPEQLAKDPKNQLLSHGPRFRMDAEMLRDIALQSGGLLVRKIGGPSVKPYQPVNIWEQVSYSGSDTLHYVQDHGDALYRRSMYSYWKRMAMMPDMDAFDAPMRDMACTRRQRTNTPLQALVTMDDMQWIEAARGLAQRVILEGGKTPENHIEMLSEVLLSREPGPKMTSVLMNSYEEMKKHYADDPKAAHALVSVGESKANASIPAPELAAWTMVASEMLNLDETITK
jgi:Protein of unknown function (DUF1553)/Protein of unknown function (DUF1549)/Planctomycete cytochrome C/Concanavalin A-like lectin/glucanases superfamily